MLFGKLVFQVELDLIFKKQSTEDAINLIQYFVENDINFTDFPDENKGIIGKKIHLISSEVNKNEHLENIFKNLIEDALDTIDKNQLSTDD